MEKIKISNRLSLSRIVQGVTMPEPRVLVVPVRALLAPALAGHDMALISEAGLPAVADDSVTIVDTVSYTGLIPGKEYTLTGTLVDRETGEPVRSDGKVVTSTVAFVPDSSDGTQEVAFTFDGAGLSGHAVVAFESLTLDGQEVASHADVNDEGQTVELVPPETPEKPTPGGKLPQTGDELPIAGICALAAAGCAASVIGIARSIGSRRREEDEGEED